jgi:hypothetical protein
MSGGTISSPRSLPTAWSRVYPKVCSAAGFQSITVPSVPITTMQSSAASRIERVTPSKGRSPPTLRNRAASDAIAPVSAPPPGP